MKIAVHEFYMGDVDDIEVYIADPLYKWEKSEQGQWVMDRAITPPVWNTGWDISRYGVRVVITADLREEDATYFTLKWGIK